LNFRRLASCLVALIALHPATAAATTAVSLSGRIQLDGRLDDYAPDEWILDENSPFPERSDDSRWGSDNDVARVALTWDSSWLYLAVDFTAQASGLLVMIGNGPGGVATLEATGEFRRAVDLPFESNLLLLAVPGSEPRVARVDSAHPFGLLDRATVPALVARNEDGRAVFEAWIPWTVINATQAVRISAVITGQTGGGAGDAAPDSRTVLSSDRWARAVIDRHAMVVADADGNNAPDTGVSPRAAARIEPDTASPAARGDADIEVVAAPAVFAPDRGDLGVFTIRSPAGPFASISGRCLIHAMDGRRIRTIEIPQAGDVNTVTVAWDGRDDAGNICDGSMYVAAFDVEFVSGGSRQRVTKRTGIAVVR
jgi:hypothetical protein